MSIQRKFSLGLLSAFIVTVAACQENPETGDRQLTQMPDQASDVQMPDDTSEVTSSEATKATGAIETSDRLLMLGVDDPQILKDFLAKLRDAASANKRDEIAEMVKYPFSTYEMGEVQKTYESSAEFLTDYDSVITPKVSAALKSANAESLFINQDGGSIDDGTVWINSFENGLRIYRING